MGGLIRSRQVVGRTIRGASADKLPKIQAIKYSRGAHSFDFHWLIVKVIDSAIISPNSIKMKKIIIALLCLSFYITSAHSQSILACQFNDATGFIHKSGKWNRTGFNVEKPFFMKIKSNGVIDESSLSGVGMTSSVQCSSIFSNSKLIKCNGNTINLAFNLNTMTGAMSSLYGAIDEEKVKDTLSVSIFSCQGM